MLARQVRIDYETLVRSRICQPLGMHDTRINLSPEMRIRLAVGHNQAMEAVSHWDVPTLEGAGALRSSANDLLTFLAANLGHIHSPLGQAMAAMRSVRRPTGQPELEVALGWHVFTVHGKEIFWHNGGTGGYRSFLGFDHASQTGVVVLSNAFTIVGVDDIGRHLLDPAISLMKPPKDHQQVTVDPKLFDRYVGRYRLATNFILAVTREGGQLFVQATGQSKFEIFPESDRDYFLKVVNAQITFVLDDKGRVTELILRQNGRELPGPKLSLEE